MEGQTSLIVELVVSNDVLIFKKKILEQVLGVRMTFIKLYSSKSEWVKKTPPPCDNVISETMWNRVKLCSQVPDIHRKVYFTQDFYF